LAAIVRKRLGLEASLYQILQILSLTQFENPQFYRQFRCLTVTLTYLILATI
jgi:hypothetical protein